MKLPRGSILIVASHNRGKVREIKALLGPHGIEPVSVGELGLPEPEETGSTFAANAALKARAAADAGKHPALADDSGLWVNALNGDPGIYSARWAGPDKDFKLAMARVERELGERNAQDRSAKFVCALALAMPHGECQTFQGEVHGTLTFPPRGLLGFGYDPIFIPDGFEQTFGEIDPHKKNAMSHRARAFEKLLHSGILAESFLTPMAFGIYVHWPFCAAKCPYCDFNSHVRAAIDEKGWVDAIERELEWTAASQGAERPIVETIFFGGGTPSLMQGASVARILDAISRRWRLANDVEVTLEANPASADAARFADYRAAGVNRLSLGMQALNDADLKLLGRLHNAAEAQAALALAMKHFERVSLDLIYARPNQSDAAWRAELKQALAFGTDHLSLYQLTIEPETPFALLHRNGQLRIPDDDLAAGLYETTQELTEAAGRPAYEISNHARLGSESRHNLIYWRYGDYAGVGPGAHGRLMLDGKRIATATIRLPERWRDAVSKGESAFTDFTAIEDADAAREHLLMNLRLAEGVDLAAYETRWGTRPSEAKVATLIGQGLLRQNGSIVAATLPGRLVLNAVIAELLN